MNVHRRDRARLKQSPPEIPDPQIVVSRITRSDGGQCERDRDEDGFVCKRHKLCSIDEIDLELRL